MRLVLAEIAPIPGDVASNARRAVEILRAGGGAITVLPELYLTGYAIGDRLHRQALRLTDHDPTVGTLREAAREVRHSIVVGAPTRGQTRAGEIENAAVAIDATGRIQLQAKRYLPTYGPFEEGRYFSPTSTSAPIELEARRIGLQICYDVFFPEVSRELAARGAELLVVLSASPVTSARLFERVLPARAVENAVPVVFVNRVGVEDGLVFGGGSGAWDARGEPLDLEPVAGTSVGDGERIVAVDLDLDAGARWRPFRPVLRDVASRPPAGGHRSGDSGRTDLL